MLSFAIFYIIILFLLNYRRSVTRYRESIKIKPEIPICEKIPINNYYIDESDFQNISYSTPSKQTYEDLPIAKVDREIIHYIIQ